MHSRAYEPIFKHMSSKVLKAKNTRYVSQNNDEWSPRDHIIDFTSKLTRNQHNLNPQPLDVYSKIYTDNMEKRLARMHGNKTVNYKRNTTNNSIINSYTGTN